MDGEVEVVAFLCACVESVGGDDEDHSDDESFHVGHLKLIVIIIGYESKKWHQMPLYE